MKMKCFAALAALVLGQPASVRGLKVPTNAVWSKELEAENEALRKRNSNLESMMQMARSEVQRMDAAVSANKRRRESCVDSDGEVLKQEIEDLKKKLRQADVDKNDLVQSLRHMLAKNSTQSFQREATRAQQLAERAQESKMELELKCGQERQALQAQVEAAKGKCDDGKELAQNLQAENADLTQKLQDARAELGKTAETSKELGSDKKNLLTTMQRLMRDNSGLKHKLENEKDVEKKEAAQLASEKILLAKAIKKLPASPAKKQVKTILRSFPRHHERLSEKQQAHMREMDKYIDSAEPGDVKDIDDQQLRAVRRQDDLIAKGKVGAHLSSWLGIKAPAPKPPPEDAAEALLKSRAGSVKVPAQKDADDGGEAEAEALVTQAKAQLAAMG